MLGLAGQGVELRIVEICSEGIHDGKGLSCIPCAR